MASKAYPASQVGIKGHVGISFHRTGRVDDAAFESIQKTHLPNHGENTAYTLMPVAKDDLESGDFYHLYTKGELRLYHLLDSKRPLKNLESAGEAMAIRAKFLESEGHNPTTFWQRAFKLEIEVPGVNVASPNLNPSREPTPLDNHFIVCNEAVLRTVWVDGHTVGIDKEDSISRLVRQFVLIRAGTVHAVFKQLGAPDASPDFKIRITQGSKRVYPTDTFHYHAGLRLGGELEGFPSMDRCLDMAPGGLIKQKAEKPRGQYDWDSTSAIEITVRIRPWSLKDPKLPELPPKPKAIGKAVGWNRGTDSSLRSIPDNDAISPSPIPFLDPQDQEVTEEPDPPGVSQNHRRTGRLSAIFRGFGRRTTKRSGSARTANAEADHHNSGKELRESKHEIFGWRFTKRAEEGRR
ncbi:hypothetical protein QBC43DRAFT_326725 [Cladorrhinum sp. PSN259]|nr:hypothetical protein QBC43DRAFT_326725 [Cladorrhinum sp. PSN259]